MPVEIWYENGRGLLFAGWYAAGDEAPRQGPFETKNEAEGTIEHKQDDDCTVVAGACTICGVSHTSPCAACGGSGFHLAGCLEVLG
jgi:hypothetical protein